MTSKNIDFNGWKISIYGNGPKEYINKLTNIIIKIICKSFFEKRYFKDEKYKILSSASAFILPSYSESFGIGVAEAMYFALPIITTTKTPWATIRKEILVGL